MVSTLNVPSAFCTPPGSDRPLLLGGACSSSAPGLFLSGTSTTTGAWGVSLSVSRPAISLPGAGTTRTTLPSPGTGSSSGILDRRVNSCGPGSSGLPGRKTHSPRLSASTTPRSFSLSIMVTLDPGCARPAMTVSPLGSMRTTSKLGGLTAVGSPGCVLEGSADVC